ncbi:MAG TPA: rod shape-determining protein MreC [Candidatus Acutalibacter pullistercoris]|uniref:Cell shape-determining protein MreC n=1 Tax=Candidatus Acutalibacter pullistercoris TaxID=2838418 RepID=A0A9D1YE25_9FIRM|nr:rod shape-determining protein MreC [Candidatus Acutalibacter pullistercoris]
MKDFFKTSSFRVLIIAVVVLLGLIIYTATAGGSFLANLLGFATSPMQSIATDVTGNVTEFLDLDGYTKDELKDLVGALQEENAQLEDQLVGYEELQQENEQLKTQLGLEEEEPENELRSASVIGRDPNDVFYGFSIDAGTLSGVSVGDPVITDQGLVGVVTQAYATSSKVTCLLSEDVHVAAWSPKRQESGVIESDVTSASTGVLRLNYLSGDTQIQEGDIIATSGEGGAFPQGLKIGTVARVEKSENDISRYAEIQPFEDLTKVQEVYVVVDFPGKGEGAPQEEPEASAPSEEDPE